MSLSVALPAGIGLNVQGDWYLDFCHGHNSSICGCALGSPAVLLWFTPRIFGDDRKIEADIHVARRK